MNNASNRQKISVTSPLSQDDTGKRFISAKQPSSKMQRDWYPYYAGFTEKFVANVLSEHMHSCQKVLDPWSGSGTTTAVCIKNGFVSKGLDINPALTVIARGRLAPVRMKQDLLHFATQIADEVDNVNPNISSSDLLQLWLADDAVYHIRCIQEAIHRVLAVDRPDNYYTDMHLTVDNFSVILSFFYTALFSSVQSFWIDFAPRIQCGSRNLQFRQNKSTLPNSYSCAHSVALLNNLQTGYRCLNQFCRTMTSRLQQWMRTISPMTHSFLML